MRTQNVYHIIQSFGCFGVFWLLLAAASTFFHKREHFSNGTKRMNKESMIELGFMCETLGARFKSPIAERIFVVANCNHDLSIVFHFESKATASEKQPKIRLNKTRRTKSVLNRYVWRIPEMRSTAPVLVLI